MRLVFSSPPWNDAVHYIGHFLVRIGRHDESKPDPRSRRRPVAARVKINSGGWIRVRDLLEYDRDRELNHSGPHIISATAFLQTFLTDNKGRIVVSFPHYLDVVGNHPDDYGFIPDIYFRLSGGHSRINVNPEKVARVLTREDLSWLPSMVLHGTDEVGARGIVQDRRMIPGGPVGQRLAIQFAADMSSTGVQQIVP